MIKKIVLRIDESDLVDLRNELEKYNLETWSPKLEKVLGELSHKVSEAADEHELDQMIAESDDDMTAHINSHVGFDIC